MDKKRGYNIKYLLLFTSAAALLCALAAYISINDTYKYTRERAAFLAESYGSQTRYELMDLYGRRRRGPRPAAQRTDGSL